MLPIVATLVLAALGAAFLFFTARHLGFARPVWMGIVGALGAGLGAQALVAPLNYCMFTPAPTDPPALYQNGPEDAVVGLILLSAGALVAVLVGQGLLSLWMRRQTRRPTEAQSSGSFRSAWLAVFFLAPTLVILLLFLYYPALDTFALATQLTRLGARRSIFVCVDNFANLLIDPEYGQAIFTTFFIGVMVVVLSMALALAIATVAYLPIKGARIYRTLLIWPYAISPVVAGIIFLLIFNPTGGIFNYFAQGLVGLKIDWFTDATAARWAIIIASVWKSLGFNILFYTAGLQTVPKDLLEAAAIDGANAVQRFRRIVIPSLGPITFFLVITNITYAFFETFGTIDYLTNGGPQGATNTMMYRIYDIGIVQNDLGKGAAQSIVLFLLVIGITLLQFRTQERNVSYGA